MKIYKIQAVIVASTKLLVLIDNFVTSLKLNELIYRIIEEFGHINQFNN